MSAPPSVAVAGDTRSLRFKPAGAPLFQTTEERAHDELLDADLESRRLTAGPVARWDWPKVNRSLSRVAAAWQALDEARSRA